MKSDPSFVYNYFINACSIGNVYREVSLMAGGKFFGMDGPFIKYGSLVFDMIMLSIVWLLLSGILPGTILLGSGILIPLPGPLALIILVICYLHWFPATVALVYTFGKKQRGTDTYTMRDYWHSYTSNYKQGMIISLIVTLVLALVLYNLWLLAKNDFGFMYYIMFPLELLAAMEIIFLSIYMLGLVARFDMRVKDFFRYAFLMANKHLLTTILLTVLLGGAFYLCYWLNFIFLAAIPGVYTYIQAGLLERVFKNYMPDQDKELEEEELDGFSLDAERQAIIDRYLGQTKYDDEGEYRYVKVENGVDVVQEDNYKIVRVHDEGEDASADVALPEENPDQTEAEEDASPENMSDEEKYLL